MKQEPVKEAGTGEVPDQSTSKIGIACVGILVLFVAALLGAVIFLGPGR